MHNVYLSSMARSVTDSTLLRRLTSSVICTDCDSLVLGSFAQQKMEKSVTHIQEPISLAYY